jgi:ferrochelatase
MPEPPVGVLVMAYGTASGPDDVERYYTDIRGGRKPPPEHLRELRARYAAIGNVFPLLDITRAQAEGLVSALNSDGRTRFRAYLGMKHSPPFIAEAVTRMREDAVERAVGIVMAPHWSAMSVETYFDRIRESLDGAEHRPSFTYIPSWHQHPDFIEFVSGRVRSAVDRLPSAERDGAAVIFTAHSLPVRTVADGSRRCLRCSCKDSCRYRDGLVETGELVAGTIGLPFWTVAWQSAGRTSDPWWGPPLEEVIEQVAAAGHSACVVCAAGFVADHLEILYDLDIEARRRAEKAGIRFERTEMPNADPGFCAALANVVREHLHAET